MIVQSTTMKNTRGRVLGALWIGTLIVLLHAQCQTSNTYEGSKNCLTGNRTDTCNLAELTDASFMVLDAVENVSSHILCGVRSNDTFLTKKLQRLQNQLGQILQSTLSLLAELDTEAGADIAVISDALKDLNEGNLDNLKFVESWVYVKLLPVLPYLTEDFLTRLSQIDFSCDAYQIM
ncbi:uncharacterized protein LOC143483966 [Brachyhypopomus gauderio]|uniref:uncharacterized protein LOC143483966 n=1 Tax=Brachyhypopomus gauderio TaxID=698409 RepID=UPI004042E9C2